MREESKECLAHFILAVICTVLLYLVFSPILGIKDASVTQNLKIQGIYGPGSIGGVESSAPKMIFDPGSIISIKVIQNHSIQFYFSCILAVLSIAFWNLWAGSFARVLSQTKYTRNDSMR